MKAAPRGLLSQSAAVVSAFAGAIVTAVLLMLMPNSASTYVNGNDPNRIDLRVDSFQDALDGAILKCALDRPDCIGTTASSSGSATITTDGTNFGLHLQVPGGLPPLEGTIKGKDMGRFRNQLAFANSLAPVEHLQDPNDPSILSDHSIVSQTLDPNDCCRTTDADIRISSTLRMKIRTADGRKGVLAVSVSPSLAVRWDLQLK